MKLWTKREDRPTKPGFTRYLPHAERLMPIWDELANLAEQEERRMEVILNGSKTYVLLGNPENGAEVARVCSSGTRKLEVCDAARAAFREAYDRQASAVRHVLHMEWRPVLMTSSKKLGVAIEGMCEE